jgi:hypothetical protein
VSTIIVPAVGDPDRIGVLVIRAWLEEGGVSSDLRARITQTLDTAAPSPVEAVAASEEEIVAIVVAWLRAFTGRADEPMSDGP